MLIILLLKLALPNLNGQLERLNNKKGQIPLSEIVLSDMQSNIFIKQIPTIALKKTPFLRRLFA